MSFQRPEATLSSRPAFWNAFPMLCIRSMKLSYSFQYLQWVGQPGGSGLCWYLACLSGGAAGVGRTEAAAGLGGSVFVVSTRVVLTGVGAGVVVLVATSVVLVAVVSRRAGPAAFCGSGSC